MNRWMKRSYLKLCHEKQRKKDFMQLWVNIGIIFLKSYKSFKWFRV